MRRLKPFMRKHWPIITGLVVGLSVAEVVSKSIMYPWIDSFFEQVDTVEVIEPPVYSATGQWGKTLFIEHCATCHGGNAAGGMSGPPLVHEYYKESEMDDQGFYRAVQNGVGQNNWVMGDMMPMSETVSIIETRAIIEYIRELQSHNGLFPSQYTY